MIINQDISEGYWLVTVQDNVGRYHTVTAHREEIGPRVDFKGGYRAFIHKIKARPKVGVTGPAVSNDTSVWLLSQFKAVQDLIAKQQTGGNK